MKHKNIELSFKQAVIAKMLDVPLKEIKKHLPKNKLGKFFIKQLKKY
jgi:hypothetical protein